jgi:hypothetical protein
MFVPDPGSRIRIFSIPDPGFWIQIFLSWIPDPRSTFFPSGILDPGSASKNLSILTQKNGFSALRNINGCPYTGNIFTFKNQWYSAQDFYIKNKIKCSVPENLRIISTKRVLDPDFPSWIRIPDPYPDFLPIPDPDLVSQIPNPGVKKAPEP